MSVVRFGNTTSGSNDIVEEISRKVPKGEQIRILQDTFPAGRVHGKHFTSDHCLVIRGNR